MLNIVNVEIFCEGGKEIKFKHLWGKQCRTLLQRAISHKLWFQNMTFELYNQYRTWYSLDTICSACLIILSWAIYLIQWLLSINFTPHLLPCIILEAFVQSICTQFVLWGMICQMEFLIQRASHIRKHRTQKKLTCSEFLFCSVVSL